MVAAELSAFGQNIADLQLFAPADLGGFGGGRRANEGFFFSYDQLHWWIQSPNIAKVGDQGERFVLTGVLNQPVADGFPPGIYYETLGYTQSSTADTSDLAWKTSSGQRYEMGWMSTHEGLMVSVTHLQPQSEILYIDGADLFFNDPDDLMVGVIGDGNIVVPDFGNPPNTIATTEPVEGPLPITFPQLRAKYRIDPWSVEINYLRRSHALHHGGFLEVMGGVRYMEFNDRLDFDGLGGTLSDSFWRYEAENHIIGPQVGARYFKMAGRWMLNAEGRFTAGFNSQNVHHDSRLNVLNPGAVGNPSNWTGAHTSSGAFQNEWAPMGELRVELRCLVTRAISLHLGWTGLWMDGVVRSPSVIDYTLPNMGINMAHNREDLFMHGLTFGIDINR